MKLSVLRDKVFYYFVKSDVNPEFLSGTEDMILLSLNGARKRAEQLIAFELNKRRLTYSSVTSSFLWGEAYSSVEDDDVPVRSLKKLWVDAEELPLEYSLLIDRGCLERKAFLVGPQVRVFPELAGNEVIAEGYIWMPEWTSYDDESWIIDHGWTYLFQSAVHDLNHRFKEFVPRTEGNLALTEQQIDMALQGLVIWNNQLKNGPFNIV